MEAKGATAASEIFDERAAQLMSINAEMFEGTIRVLGQQNTALHQQLSVLTQQHTVLHQDLSVLTQQNTALYQQLSVLTAANAALHQHVSELIAKLTRK